MQGLTLGIGAVVSPSGAILGTMLDGMLWRRHKVISGNTQSPRLRKFPGGWRKAPKGRQAPRPLGLCHL
jgi:hypothetical protein